MAGGAPATEAPAAHADPVAASEAAPTPLQPQPSVAEPSQATAAAAAFPDPASSVSPPPPAVPLPPQLGLPAKLDHADSASSVAAEPPTPLSTAPPTPAAPAGSAPSDPLATPAAAAPPASNGAVNGNGAMEADVNGCASEAYNVEAERKVEHEHAHPGLGVYPPTGAAKEGEHSSAVDVLADVAMGDAAIGLAEFASGAGSGDVKEGSPAVPADASAPVESPSLKRSAPDEGGDYLAAGQAAGETDGDREAKRLKVEPEVRTALRAPVLHLEAHRVAPSPLLRRLLPCLLLPPLSRRPPPLLLPPSKPLPPLPSRPPLPTPPLPPFLPRPSPSL